MANVFLHYVFDLWVSHWRILHARGNLIVVRYADDVVVGFEKADDAQRFLVALRERLEKFLLTLHPDKTRLIEFGRFAAVDRKKRGRGKPETFDFLRFTHICRRGREGNFQLKRKTRRDRMRGKLQEFKAELRRRMHQTIPQQGQWLRQVVHGFFAYHAVPTNSGSISAFRHHIISLWRCTPRRRSQQDQTRWERITQIANDWLPKPLIHHPWPDVRFAAKHPRWEPCA